MWNSGGRHCRLAVLPYKKRILVGIRQTNLCLKLSSAETPERQRLWQLLPLQHLPFSSHSQLVLNPLLLNYSPLFLANIIPSVSDPSQSQPLQPQPPPSKPTNPRSPPLPPSFSPFGLVTALTSTDWNPVIP